MSVIGNGIGRLLLQSAFDSWGEDRAYELEVLQYNRRAIAFYKRNGFWEVPGVLVDYSVTDTMDDWPIAHLDPKHRAKRMHREPIIEV
jgi:RimJ/RimL family protein N-acetyltransferase